MEKLIKDTYGGTDALQVSLRAKIIAKVMVDMVPHTMSAADCLNIGTDDQMNAAACLGTVITFNAATTLWSEFDSSDVELSVGSTNVFLKDAGAGITGDLYRVEYEIQLPNFVDDKVENLIAAVEVKGKITNTAFGGLFIQGAQLDGALTAQGISVGAAASEGIGATKIADH